MIALDIKHNEKIINGSVIYNINDGNLDFTTKLNSDISLLVGYINVGFDSISMTANQIWGLTPRESWNERKLIIPSNIYKGQLKLLGDYNSGTWRIDKEKPWITYFDSSQNLLCFGDIINNNDDKCIEFLDNVFAVINDKKQLKSLWIKPSFTN